MSTVRGFLTFQTGSYSLRGPNIDLARSFDKPIVLMRKFRLPMDTLKKGNLGMAANGGVALTFKQF